MRKRETATLARLKAWQGNDHEATGRGTERIGPFLPATLGRCAVLLAVILQACGQVTYGTWLTSIPSPLLVFATFLVTTIFFLIVSGRGVKFPAWQPLILLNAGTALAFLSFFYALKIIEPAIASALNVGVGPLFAVLITLVATGMRPTVSQSVVCLGILCGCSILAAAASRGTGEAVASGGSAFLGVAASIATGAGAVLITVASKTLLDRGWKSGAVLAHRFYLILPISLVLATTADLSVIDWTASLAVVFAVVALIGVLVPLYLLQVGIRHSDPYTVMVTMAAMPLVTFAIQGLSPAYAWTWMTATGLVVITAFILIDLFTGKVKPQTC